MSAVPNLDYRVLDYDVFSGTKHILAAPAVKDGNDGYAVVYPDGYCSWSPKDVFEAAYKQSGFMTFDQALYWMSLGLRIFNYEWTIPDGGGRSYLVIVDKATGLNVDIVPDDVVPPTRAILKRNALTEKWEHFEVTNEILFSNSWGLINTVLNFPMMKQTETNVPFEVQDYFRAGI